jgi:hypothetical protein
LTAPGTKTSSKEGFFLFLAIPKLRDAIPMARDAKLPN